MKTKEKIIEKIQNIDNEAILEDILAIINLELKLLEDTVLLSNEQQSAIEEGLKDLEEGRFFSNEEVRKMTDEWLRKK